MFPQSQSRGEKGKPVVRRGRKARDLLRRPPGRRSPVLTQRLTKESIVKANLARFTVALSLLATIALTLGAGLKWY